MNELTDLLNQFAEACLALGQADFGLEQIKNVPTDVLVNTLKIKKRKAELGAQIVALFNQAILEAMRDQRHACAEAVNELEGGTLMPDGREYISKERASKAVMNADARDVARAQGEVAHSAVKAAEEKL